MASAALTWSCSAGLELGQVVDLLPPVQVRQLRRRRRSKLPASRSATAAKYRASFCSPNGRRHGRAPPGVGDRVERRLGPGVVALDQLQLAELHADARLDADLAVVELLQVGDRLVGRPACGPGRPGAGSGTGRTRSSVVAELGRSASDRADAALSWAWSWAKLLPLLILPAGSRPRLAAGRAGRPFWNMWRTVSTTGLSWAWTRPGSRRSTPARSRSAVMPAAVQLVRLLLQRGGVGRLGSTSGSSALATRSASARRSAGLSPGGVGQLLQLDDGLLLVPLGRGHLERRPGRGRAGCPARRPPGGP